MSLAENQINYRPMTANDIGKVPIGHQGTPDEVRHRISRLGSSAILAFDAEKHVGQLQFRHYDSGVRSPRGLWDPLYWGDFGEHAPRLPSRTLSVYCYHVGQLEDNDERDASYQGRGIGLQLLDLLLFWAEEQGFEAIVAKATPTPRSVMGFMGGQAPRTYVDRGFNVFATVVDSELKQIARDRKLVGPGANLEDAARISYCVKSL